MDQLFRNNRRSFLTGRRCLVTMVVCSSLLLAPPSLAQTTLDQTYNCGAYGAGTYGHTECLAADDTSTSASPTPLPTTAPTAEGSFPTTGANLGLWAALGALVLAIGLGLLGCSRRQHRARQ